MKCLRPDAGCPSDGLEDEWQPVPERITNEQVVAMNRLLSMPFVEHDLVIFAEED